MTRFLCLLGVGVALMMGCAGCGTAQATIGTVMFQGQSTTMISAPLGSWAKGQRDAWISGFAIGGALGFIAEAQIRGAAAPRRQDQGR